MLELFGRTLSQGLQAFMPVAMAAAWLARREATAGRAALRVGVAAAIPLTAAAGALYLRSAVQVRWELSMAAAAVGITFAARRRLRRRADAQHRHRASDVLIAVVSAFVVVRQTMLIAAAFIPAAFEVRSFDATAAVTAGIVASAVAAVAALILVRRVPLDAEEGAMGVFTGLFLAQAVFYTIHKGAEARLWPGSEWLDNATESFGPDSRFGWYVSGLLALIPLIAAAINAMRAFAPVDRIRAAMSRTRAAALVCAAVLVPAIATAFADARAPNLTAEPIPVGAVEAPPDVASATKVPQLLFVSRNPASPSYPRLATAPLQNLTAVASTELNCQRVSFAAGRGICLQADRGMFTTYRAVLLDDRLRPRASIKLDGVPSRTRVSPDGRVGAMTVFVTGAAHGYAKGTFSTKTTLVDMASGDVIADLEQFQTRRDGTRISAVDFNFWGVTFARDHNTLYATLRTAGHTYLVRGDLGLRKLTVMTENVECPSISPDDRLIAFKKRVGPSLAPWRLWVLDLTTLQEHAVEGETRSVDDQVEWLDATHILYSLPRSSQSAAVDVWIVAVDGHERAQTYLVNAESPIVVR